MTTRNRQPHTPLTHYRCDGPCKQVKPAAEFYPPTQRGRIGTAHQRRRCICNECSNLAQKAKYEEKRGELISDRALAALPSIIQKAGLHPTRSVKDLYTEIAHILADDMKAMPATVEIFLEAFKARVNEHVEAVQRQAETVRRVE